MEINKETIKKKAVIYCRVSTKEQVDEGNSLSTQEKICREYCSKNEYEIAEIFIEQGESAKTADRTELQKLLSYCANKKNAIRSVVIYKLDRLSRNTDDYSQLRLLLKRYGVEIKSTSEYFENTPVGRFMENTMANIAQFDNDIRTERCIGGMREAMREGRYVWKAPLGYDNIRIAGKVTIGLSATKANIMRETFELIAKNTYPIDEVRKIMIRNGLLNRIGKPVSRSYFYNMLKNEIYAGWIIKFGERHKGTFKPLISDDLFQQVQRVLKWKGKKHSIYRTDHPDFPLRRFVVTHDGRKLSGSWSQGRNKKYPYYRFSRNGLNYSRDKFERVFKIFMDEFSFDQRNFENLRAFVHEQLTLTLQNQVKEKSRLRKYIKEIEDRQSAIIKKNLVGVISDTVLQQQLKIIEEELMDSNALFYQIDEKTEVNFDELLFFIKEYMKNPSKIWTNATIRTKIRLQRFQFPFGVCFENNTFRTTEIPNLFKVKSIFNNPISSKVDSSEKISNNRVIPNKEFVDKLARECIQLRDILQDKPDTAPG